MLRLVLLRWALSLLLTWKKVSALSPLKKTVRAVVSSLMMAGGVTASALAADFDEEYDVKAWTEIAVNLPPSPRQQDLVRFYVSAATDNLFFVDSASVSVGEDGVVRYALVIEAAGGARSVSYEGIRCQTREHRIYASGRRDGSWSKSRNNEWARIQEVYANRYSAALFLDYFCPLGTIVKNANEARQALRSGGHTDLLLGR